MEGILGIYVTLQAETSLYFALIGISRNIIIIIDNT